MEIKFRAWDKENEVMIYPKGVLFDGRVVNFSCGMLEPFEGYELMQYTGLKDKNGKEIYEGDILHESVSTSGILRNVIVYGHGGFEHKWLVERTANIRGKKQEPMFRNTSIIFEVIGNIYENPELLEGAE